MTNTIRVLTALAILALSAAPVRAEEPGMMDDVKMGFSQAIKDIQTWFGDDTPDTVEPAAGENGFDVTAEDALQVPPPVDPSMVEPAAGAYDDDALQVPPPYMGPDNSDSTGTPRASAFDDNASTMAFGDADTLPVIEDYNAIAPAAGEGEDAAASENLDCAAIESAQAAGEDVDAALIRDCAAQKLLEQLPAADSAATVSTDVPMIEEKSPAQPAFEITPMPAEPAVAPAIPGELPETQPSTGE